MHQFKPGDRVQEQGEGPVMTVVELRHGLAVCQWIDEHGGVDHKAIALADLTEAEEGPETEDIDEDEE